jgi:hypothetical protein
MPFSPKYQSRSAFTLIFRFGGGKKAIQIAVQVVPVRGLGEPN